MDRPAFYAALRRRDSGVFGTKLSQQQVNGIEGILDAFVTHGDGRAKTLAYALATAYLETGRRMVPVREGFAKTDLGARRAVNALARKRGPNSNVAKYARPQPPYGHVYYGRGHVQQTWIDNYRESSADAGVDLVKNPDAMLDPQVSARILIKGLLDGRWNAKGKGIAHYLPTGGRDDLKNARRTVNITDKWSEIGGYYRSFLAALQEAGWKQAPLPRPKPAPSPSTTYTVRSGDTLSDIALRHGVDLHKLAALNGIRNLDVIRVGDVLHIPAQMPQERPKPVPAPPRPPAPSRLPPAPPEPETGRSYWPVLVLGLLLGGAAAALYLLT